MISLAIENHIAIIAIDRPDKKNALTLKLWQELSRHIARVSDLNDVRILILRGAGADFCAGADIGEFDKVRANPASAQEYEAANITAFAAIRECPIPTLAAIKGCCFGGGFGIAAACDLRIAQTDARFCVPPARLGLAYPVEAMADIVHALGPQRAKAMAYSAAVIDAQAALEFGFLLQVCAAKDFETSIENTATSICECAPLSNRASKASILAALSHKQCDTEMAVRYGNLTFKSDDYAEGRAAFREKRKPVFRGS